MDNNLENNNFNNEQSKFGLPEGYFQKSTINIFNKIEWQEEHKNYVRLLLHKNNHDKYRDGFVVPENYFEEAWISISHTFKNNEENELKEFVTLASHKKNNPFIVPQNYFEEAEVKETAKSLIFYENELIEFYKLSYTKKQNSFIVNESYFSENEEKLKSLLITKPIKVINLFNAKMWYSVAALLVIALGLWMYNSYYKIAPIEDCGTLACIEKRDLVKAKHLENIENEELYKLVNTKKLEENLASSGLDNTNNKQDTDTSSKTDEDELLDEL